MAAGKLNAALAMTSDEVRFGGPDGSKMSKAELRKLFEWVGPKFAGPMEQKIVGTTAEGNRVAVEATGRVPLVNGKTYENIYHLIFELSDGVIVATREYCNTVALQVFQD